MDDRELLELAARATGIEPLYWSDGQEPYSSGPGIIYGDNWIWNPLTDSGDAFLLMVACKLNVDCSDSHPSSLAYLESDIESTYAEVPHSDDPCAATRRAIVNAAAAIAQEMTDAQG